MKRHSSLIALLLVLALLLTACGSAMPAAVKNDAAEPAGEKAGGKAPAGDAGADAPGEPEMEGGVFGDYAVRDGGGSPAVYGAPGSGAAPGSGETPISAPGSGEDPEPAEEPGEDPEPVQAQGLLLTAAEWNDNQNWPFFTNLVNEGRIRFPSFGIDPRQRLQVTLRSEADAPLVNEPVVLLDEDGGVLWSARSDKDGVAYLFWTPEQRPAKVVSGGAEAEVTLREDGGDGQGAALMRPQDSILLQAAATVPAQQGMQILFIVDTTGSMGDELAYLQKDFSAIAGRVGGEALQWSVSFYRDEGDDYVTRHSPFTASVAELQAKINAEYADGGGDTPEAVAQVLTECLTRREDWDENAVKLAFLIFDAPPHEGREEELQAAIRSAAERGIRLIPVVASNADRETELFGRAAAICTNGSYVFLTDDSGVGNSHLEPIVGSYEVKLLQDLIVEIIQRYR